MTRDELEQVIYERTRYFVEERVMDCIIELIAAEREAERRYFVEERVMDCILELIAAEREAEREACARVCENGLPIASSMTALDDMEMWGEKFAAAIRARGSK